MNRKTPLLFAAMAALSACPAFAQLRIVSMNGANTLNTDNGTTSVGPRNGTLPGQDQWMTNILTAIGSSVSDDPTMAGNTGIIKPLDILCLSESDGFATTGQQYANLLNTIYPTANFQVAHLDGAYTDPHKSTQTMVYNANTVLLAGTKAVGSISTSGQPRQELRFQVRPVGYTSTSDFYIYSGHYKSSADSTSKGRRNTEAIAVRNDADTLPANSSIIYSGDLNIYTNSEAMWSTLTTAAGSGTNHADTAAIDPVHQVGIWDNHAQFAPVHTQSPFDQATATAQNQGFVGSSGGMDDRFDWQLSTANMQDGHGVAYIPNSYQAFGNNGSTPMNAFVDDPSNTAASPTVLRDMATILDHLPVVADYQLPAMQSVTVGTVPTRVISAASASVEVTVANSAPVMYALGADTLAYALSTSGAASGSATSTATALAAGNVHTVSLDTSGYGAKAGVINVNSTSESVANGDFTQNVNYTAVDHAQPSLASATSSTAQTIDFGYVPAGFAPRTASFAVFNNESTVAGVNTASLDVDGVVSTGSALMTTNVTATNPAAPLAVDGSLAYTATFTPDTVAGAASADHTIAVSDENIPGAIGRGNLVVTTVGRTFTDATFPVTGLLNLLTGETLNTGPFSIQTNVTLTKNGPGVMNITGPQNNAVGSQLAVSGGAVNFATDAGSTSSATLGVTVNAGAAANFSASQHLASLAVAGGRATVAEHGAHVVATGALSITAGGKLDLRDNNLIVHNGAAGAPTGGIYSGISGLVQSGRNGGAWSGSGIVTTETSAGAATQLTTIAVASNADLHRTTFAGESVSPTDVLAMYTYAGDANLSGTIDADDYFQIDSNYNQPPSALNYYKGDFNYDGVVNGDDYFLIDTNFAAQSGSLAPGAAFGVSAVPEPVTPLALLALAWMAPRRRRGAAAAI